MNQNNKCIYTYISTINNFGCIYFSYTADPHLIMSEIHSLQNLCPQ